MVHGLNVVPFRLMIEKNRFSGNNETPLRYTAGMVLAVPVDAELFNLSDDHVSAFHISKNFNEIKRCNKICFAGKDGPLMHQIT